MNIDPLKTLIDFLFGIVAVNDDDGDAIAITVSGAWPDERNDVPWVSIGPTIWETEQTWDLGAFTLRVDGRVQCDIWVREPPDRALVGRNYKRDELAFKIKENIRALIWAQVKTLVNGLHIVKVEGWGPHFPPEENLSRVRGEISYFFEEDRPI